MEDTQHDRLTVYEIGYLLIPSITDEKVGGEADGIRIILTDSGASIISDENPHLETLSYSMRKKNVSGSYEKYDRAYFGWIKFEVDSLKVEDIKKSIEIKPSVLRSLLITTVRENTYLGKRAVSIARAPQPIEEKKEITPATIEEMDRTIDAMVKEV